jgi:hypothetical protein
MNARMPWSLGVLCGLALLTAMPATAKEFPMQALSRNVVEQACSRAGGSAYGMLDDAGAYGCQTARGSVTCEADATCSGHVSDLRPLPTNSIDAILGAGIRGIPIMIRPANHRVAPRAGQ